MPNAQTERMGLIPRFDFVWDPTGVGKRSNSHGWLKWKMNRVDMYIGQLSWLPEDITLNDKSQVIQEYDHG